MSASRAQWRQYGDFHGLPSNSKRRSALPRWRSREPPHRDRTLRRCHRRRRRDVGSLGRLRNRRAPDRGAAGKGIDPCLSHHGAVGRNLYRELRKFGHPDVDGREPRLLHRPSGRLRPSPGHLPAAADHRRLRAHGCTAGIAPPGCSARVQHRAGRRRGGRGDQPLPTTRIHPAGDGRFDADGARCSWPAPGICAWPASAWGNHCEVGRNRERGPPTWALGPAGLLGAGLRGSDRHQCRGGVVR
ncbi:Uncharacterised protein [Mycobacteroides abscessus subsp. abscessus]|nr:Uncharacterised protein [Mycobacteroides abscessus subsp. abscessus]